MKRIVHSDASYEFDLAISYYDEREPDLGLSFAKEVENTIIRIEDFPYAWSSCSKQIRRSILDRFPYEVVYRILDEDTIYILAIAHLHRKQNYWKNRI